MPRKNRRIKQKRLGQRSLMHLARSVEVRPHRMEIWFACLREEAGSSLQSGARPVIIVGNNQGNTHSDVVTAIPMTSREKRLDLPTHVRLFSKDNPGLDRDSTVLVEQITTIDKLRLRHRWGEVTDPESIRQIEKAIAVQLGMTI